MKRTVGNATGNQHLEEEGEAQRDKGASQRAAAEHEAEASEARAGARATKPASAPASDRHAGSFHAPRRSTGTSGHEVMSAAEGRSARLGRSRSGGQ